MKGVVSTACICLALLLLVITISGCGGGSYANGPAGAVGETPPAVATENHWGTSFEANEGYSAGSIIGQEGWTQGYWDPRPGNFSADISTDQSSTGTQSLKLNYASSETGVWWENICSIVSAAGITPSIQMDSVTFRMKIYRDPGETEFPEGSGIMHPNIWFNQFIYNPNNRYIDFGDTQQDMKIHSSLQNSTPRTWDDPGWEQITGRFVEIVIHDDYVQGVRTTWYDGRRVATVPIYNPARTYDGFSLSYQAANPDVPANLGKPMYIDDIAVDWVPSFAK